MMLTIALLNYGYRLDKVLLLIKYRLHSVASVERRLFLLTVILAIVLLGSASTLLLCAWKIIRDVSTEWSQFLFLLVSETIPTFGIAWYLLRGIRDFQLVQTTPESGFSTAQEFDENQGVIEPYQGQLNRINSVQPDSEYGNFNPNLRVEIQGVVGGSSENQTHTRSFGTTSHKYGRLRTQITGENDEDDQNDQESESESCSSYGSLGKHSNTVAQSNLGVKLI